MDILLNSEIATLEREGSSFVVKYKPLKYKQSSEVTLEISDLDIVDVSAKAGCQSCTTTYLKTDAKTRTASLRIKYDTSNLGNFDKRVSLFHSGTMTQIRLLGTVTN